MILLGLHFNELTTIILEEHSALYMFSDHDNLTPLYRYLISSSYEIC